MLPPTLAGQSLVRSLVEFGGASKAWAVGYANSALVAREAWIRTVSSSSRACTSCSAPCIHAKRCCTAQKRSLRGVRLVRSAARSRVGADTYRQLGSLPRKRWAEMLRASDPVSVHD
jgi:hypothetical protein